MQKGGHIANSPDVDRLSIDVHRIPTFGFERDFSYFVKGGSSQSKERTSRFV
jgi:hypothetical protein